MPLEFLVFLEPVASVVLPLVLVLPLPVALPVAFDPPLDVVEELKLKTLWFGPHGPPLIILKTISNTGLIEPGAPPVPVEEDCRGTDVPGCEEDVPVCDEDAPVCGEDEAGCGADVP